MLAPGVTVRKRIVILFLLILVYLGFLVGRLAWIQLVKGEQYAKMAKNTRLRDVKVEAPRGDIVDRDGKLLAGTISAYSVFVMPPQVKNPQTTAQILSEVLGLSYDFVYARLTSDSYFEWIQRKVSDEQAKKVRELKLPGIDMTQEARRYLPEGALASHILGITGIDNQGLEGIEKVYDEELLGQDGKVLIEFDGHNRVITGGVKEYLPPKQGNTLVLTIDAPLQHIAERDLEKAIQQTGGMGGWIIVMDVKTGDILAMADWPNYDPNKWWDQPAKNRRNQAVSDSFPPGSTFKIFTAAAALEEGVISKDERFFDPGSVTISGYTISNYGNIALGSATLAEVIEFSSNVGFIQIGRRLGLEKFFKYLDAFGLTEPTGIDLPGEAVGVIRDRKDAKEIDLATMAFGQTNTYTPIAMVTAAAAIANDGVLMQPHLMKEIRSADGRVIKKWDPKPVRQVLSKETAEEMQNFLEGVILRGTGRNAFVPGYRLAGKTGTAQKVIDGKVSNEKHIAGFIGFGPLPEPRVAVFIQIDEPKGVYTGGAIAAPVFSTMMQDVMRYLEIPPTEPPEKRPATLPPVEPKPSNQQVPSLVNFPVQEARRAAQAAGFSLDVEGTGPIITSQVPPAGKMIPKGTRILASAVEEGMDSPGPGEITVPPLKGMSVAQAGETLANVGLYLRMEGTGLAVKQEPEAGTKVPKGFKVKVWFEPPR